MGYEHRATDDITANPNPKGPDVMLTLIFSAAAGAAAMAAAVRYVGAVRNRIVRPEDGPKPGLPK